MKASELRIGNILHYTDDERLKPEIRNKPFYIVADDILYLSENPDWEFIYPIPLTEEILLRCGFKHDCDLINMLCKNGIWFNRKNMEASFLSSKLIKIKYLHQLQNICYALTGEELQVNL
jgi:hypothetical protein